MTTNTEEHYREIVLQDAMLKRDVSAAIRGLLLQAQALEQQAQNMRHRLEMLLEYVRD